MLIAKNQVLKIGIKYLLKKNELVKRSYQYNYSSISKENIYIIGNRGSGKTTLGRSLAKKINNQFIDLDEQVNKYLEKQNNNVSIAKFIETQGWLAFRELQRKLLAEIINKQTNTSKIISLGGGTLDYQSNCHLLKNKKTVYLQRQFHNLVIEINENRPIIPNFKEISKKRQQIYQDSARVIVHFSEENKCDENQMSFLLKQIQRYDSVAKLQKYQPKLNNNKGLILCLNQIPEPNSTLDSILSSNIQNLSALQFRIDQILQASIKNNESPRKFTKQFRKKLSKYLFKNTFPNLPIILTLRSQEQLGCFTGNYNQAIQYISKIPTNWLDIEIQRKINLDYNVDKIIWSYHGFEQQHIQKLKKQPGMKKLCLFPQNSQTISLYNKYKNNVDICIICGNLQTRLQNKYQMVVAQPLKQNLTGILDINTMKQLRKKQQIN